VKNIIVGIDRKITATSLSNKELPEETYIYTDEGVFVSEDGSKQLSFVDESNGKTYIQIKQIYNFPDFGQTLNTSYEYEKTGPNIIDDSKQDAWDKKAEQNTIL
jgi:hypothetical protein